MKQKIFLTLLVLSSLFIANLLINSTAAPTIVTNKLDTKATETIAFLKKNKTYNQDIFILIDMKILSNKNRFFVYDAKNKKVIDQGLVAHGSGSDTDVEGILKFNNTDGSLMTSLGKYYIGNSYTGTFGKAYKMYGLDKTNSNAYTRNIVLHAHDKMPEAEQENPIILSWGCPMLNEKFYLRVQDILDKSDKKIIMNIYY